jgi:lipoprotein-anchoring transpeptidase ErfK/SrfK
VEPSSFIKLRVSIAEQRLDLLSPDGSVTASWPVSTSLLGTGTAEGSFRTPVGNFRICEKIGAGEPAWTIFRGRVSTGQIAQSAGDEDLILSRILWLEGLDPENHNTRERYIYLHGTNQETLIGTPASHGCIRLQNDHIIELFDRVEAGTLLEIIA